MGHSSTRAALIYQHASQDRDKAIAEALGKALMVARETATKKVNGTRVARKGKKSAQRSKGQVTVCRVTWPFVASRRGESNP